MRGQHFRLKSSILGIATDNDGHRVPVALPQGDTVEVIQTDINGNRLVSVSWQGKSIMMFTIDLRNRCEVVKPADAG